LDRFFISTGRLLVIREGRLADDALDCGSAVQGYRNLYSRWFNTVVAEFDEIEGFENIRVEPVGIVDCAGASRKFHLRTHLLGNTFALKGFELQNGNPAGYQIQLVGDPEEDMFALLWRLYPFSPY
jgi:hypothetical protein